MLGRCRPRPRLRGQERFDTSQPGGATAADDRDACLQLPSSGGCANRILLGAFDLHDACVMNYDLDHTKTGVPDSIENQRFHALLDFRDREFSAGALGGCSDFEGHFFLLRYVSSQSLSAWPSRNRWRPYIEDCDRGTSDNNTDSSHPRRNRVKACHEGRFVRSCYRIPNSITTNSIEIVELLL